MKPLSEIRKHPLVTVIEEGEDGAAFLIARGNLSPMRVIASWGNGWDHVSVSLKDRTPKYQEMKAIKRLFFKPGEWAVEYHPPAEDYVSINDNVLHLWRPQNLDFPIPDKEMV